MEPPRQAPTHPELSPAEYAVLFHVTDTVVVPRAQLAAYAAAHPPSVVPADLSEEACLHAIASLVERGWLVELTQADIDTDLARWQAEPLPVSWGVARDRCVGDVDATDDGARGFYLASGTPLLPSRASGYVQEAGDQIRVLGDAIETCAAQVERLLSHGVPGCDWLRDDAEVGPVAARGPWWFDRFRCIPGGFERIVRRRARSAR